MKKMICIVCPMGCHLVIDDNHKVSGNNCLRGVKYALSEISNPRRTLTTTIQTNLKQQPRVSVKSSLPLLKDKIFPVMAFLHTIIIDHPVKIGNIIISNVLDTGVDIVATKNFPEY